MTDKEQIRTEMHARRARLSSGAVLRMGHQAASRLQKLPVYQDSHLISCFVSVRGEIDTHHLIANMLAQGKRVAVPVTATDGEMVMAEVTSFADLTPAAFGLLEPHPDAATVEPTDLDLVLVPGLAFDLKGNRIGYGRGYYDAFLTGLRAPTIGLAYDFQIIDHISTSAHDVPVQTIVTDKRHVACDRNRGQLQ